MLAPVIGIKLLLNKGVLTPSRQGLNHTDDIYQMNTLNNSPIYNEFQAQSAQFWHSHGFIKIIKTTTEILGSLASEAKHRDYLFKSCFGIGGGIEIQA